MDKIKQGMSCWADEIDEDFIYSTEIKNKHIKDKQIKKKIWKLLLELIDGTITKEIFLEKKRSILTE